MSLTLKKLFVRSTPWVLIPILMPCAVGLQAQSSKLRVPLAPLVAVPMPSSSFGEELLAMSERAGVIFAGEVVAVRTQGALGSATGWVETEFRIEEAIRGCAGQATYVLREWAGLWTGGSERYAVGQRRLMLLHAPGASGMSSPVGGQDGAIPITGSGAATGPNDSSTATNDQAIDTRWLEARLLRTTSIGQHLHARPVAPLEPVLVGREQRPVAMRKVAVPGVRNNSQRFEAGRLTGGELGGGLVPAAAAVETGTSQVEPESQGVTLRSVLALLGAWEAQQANAAR